MRHQAGYAVLTWIILIGTLTAVMAGAFALGDRQNISSLQTFSTAQQIALQAQLIRAKIGRCVSDYPTGNNGTGNHAGYPYTANVAGTPLGGTPDGTAEAVSKLYCVIGASPAAADSNLWSGVDGVFLPPAPTGFNAWQYSNNGTDVRITLQTTSTSSYGAALAQAVSKFNASEAALSTTTLANDTFNLIVTK